MQSQLDDVAAQRRTALVFVDFYGHRRDYTFREVADQEQRYAAVFRALGMQAGDCVAMCNANTSKCLFMIGALRRLAVTPVYCGEDLTDDDLLSRIRHAGARFVITNRRRRPSLAWLHDTLDTQTVFLLVGDEAEGWVRIDTLADSAMTFRGQEPTEELPGVDDAARLLECDDTDRVWCTIPFGDDQWPAFMRAAGRAGVCSILHEAPFRPDERVDLLWELDPTILIQPGSEYDAMLESGVKALRLPRLRRCIAVDCGPGAQVRWEQQTGRPLVCADSGEAQPKA